MRAYRGKIFRLQAHLDRLKASATSLGLRLSIPLPQLGQRLIEALTASRIQEAVVRVALVPDAHRVAAPSIVVQRIQPPRPELYARGITLAIVPTKRCSVNDVNPQVKFSARLGSVLAITEAQLRQADEAVFLDTMGFVSESTASNLGMMRRGVFLTPPGWVGLLAGVTCQALIELADALNIPVRETILTRHDLYNADEAFLTSTIKEVLPVTMIDGRRVGTGMPGPYTKRLHQTFRQLVVREGRGESHDQRQLRRHDHC